MQEAQSGSYKNSRQDISTTQRSKDKKREYGKNRSSSTRSNQNVGRMEQPNTQRSITGRQDTDLPDHIMNMVERSEKTYPVKIELNTKTIKYLSTLNLPEQQNSTIIELSESMYQAMPVKKELRTSIVHVREYSDSTRYTFDTNDVAFLIDDLRSKYNEENPNQQYSDFRDPDGLTIDILYRLIKVIAGVTDYEQKINPEESGTSVTEEMKSEGIKPSQIFIKEDETY